MRSITNQVPRQTTSETHDHPGAIVRQEHEAEIVAAVQRFRHRVGQAGGAEIIAEDALDDQREPEGQQQSVEMIELVEPLQEQSARSRCR